ncbi:hypothetical protein Cus16_0223 [Curtobacterium sp. ER1/6]|nr:hypothetical protein Cus16_0223 [Curtobacterium sp. ER1/6]
MERRWRIRHHRPAAARAARPGLAARAARPRRAARSRPRRRRPSPSAGG